jgi:hypothetical protein
MMIKGFSLPLLSPRGFEPADEQSWWYENGFGKAIVDGNDHSEA